MRFTVQNYCFWASRTSTKFYTFFVARIIVTLSKNPLNPTKL